VARHSHSSSRASRVGLDWVNFFIADVQSGFGSFVAFYLAVLGWSRGTIGLALTVAGVAGVLSQIPGGALADATRHKRLLVAVGAVMIAAAALILALWARFPTVMAAEVLNGASAGLIGPAIGAITLGLVGRRGFSRRIGRNNSFQAAGIALTAAAMGLAGQYLAPPAIFFSAAALTLPVLAALHFIDSREIDFARARNAASRDRPHDVERLHRLLRNKPMVAFIASAVLFRFADASMLPLASENVALAKSGANILYMAGMVVAPHVVVAVTAPLAGRLADHWGRKTLFLAGLTFEAVRGVLFALVASAPGLVAIEVLDGASGATITVVTSIIAADLTAGTGRFNLAFGIIGLLAGVAATLSTLVSGYAVEITGPFWGFMAMSAVAAAAALVAFLYLPETRPHEYGELD